jgi:hypothetical protein
MTPTIVITLTRSDDAIEFECDHAVTSLAAKNESGEASRLLIQAALARHALDCACQPQRSIVRWPSMAEALAIFEEDDRHPPAWADVSMRTMGATFIQTMRERACAECDPRFSIETTKGIVKTNVAHRAGCSKHDVVGPTKARWIHFVDEARA